jgi:hypothetical protein
MLEVCHPSQNISISTSDHLHPRLRLPVSLKGTVTLSIGIITRLSAKGKEKILETLRHWVLSLALGGQSDKKLSQRNCNWAMGGAI